MSHSEHHLVDNSKLKWYTLAAACFALFMAILDNLVVNIALPTIGQELDATTTQLQWVISAYTLVFASLQITAGGLGDRFGRKRYFLFGLVLFTVASALAATSSSMEMLIAFRALQGLGAAFIMPLSLSLISNAFPPEERGQAVGIWSAVSVSSIAVGPIVGGALVEYANWKWIFLINVPIGIIAFIMTYLLVQESRDETNSSAIDIPGTLLITGFIGTLTWSLIEAGNRGWTDTYILAGFLIAAILLPLFIYVEKRTEHPMIPLEFFESRTFVGANIDSFMISFLITGVSFFLTLYQQNIHGFSAMRTGLALLPMVIVMMVFSPISGKLVNQVGSRKLISFGMIIAGIGNALFLFSGVDASYLDILPAFLAIGFGMSFIWAPMTAAVLNSVPTNQSGVASAINGAIREIGTAFGIALLGTLANRAYQSEMGSSAAIQDLSANPAYKGVIDLVSSGMSWAGDVVSKLPQAADLPDDVIKTIESVSADAFMTGMDRAIIVAAVGIFLSAILSYFLIDDDVVAHQPEDLSEMELIGSATHQA